MNANVIPLRAPSPLDHVPAELQALAAWLLWKLEGGRKVPYWVNGNRRRGEQGSSEDRAKLTTFEKARRRYERGGYAGIGLAMLPEFQLTALDFDDCVSDGVVHEKVRQLVDGTYAEISPSGTGVRAFMRGELAAADKSAEGLAAHGFKFEAYAQKQFVTVTGNALDVDDLAGTWVGQLTDAVREHAAARCPKPVEREASASTGKPHALTADDLRQMLGHIDNIDRDTWCHTLWALRRARNEHLSEETLLDLADEYSRRGSLDSYKGRGDVARKMREADGRDGYGIGTLVELARAGGWKPTPEQLERLHPRDDAETLAMFGDLSANDDLPEGKAAPDKKPGRPAMRLVGGQLHKYASACEHLLSDELYSRERQLVRVGSAPDITEPGSIRRDATQAIIVTASRHWLRRRLTERVDFQKLLRREKEWLSVDCPLELADNIAGMGDWSTFAPLEAIARAPFLRSDGSVCEEPGYDVASRVFYAPNGTFPPVPKAPTKDEAMAALVALLEPFKEFPFAADAAGDSAARSTFASHILTEVVRSAIGTAPIFFYSAPTPGTGKSLLSEMPSRIVHGTAPAMRPWSEDAELRKTLFASLLAGDRSIGFDNITRGAKIRSPILCGFLTAAIYTDRKLGVSESPTLPNRATVFATGNNLTPSSDLARRSLVVTLDASLEPAALRQRRFGISDLRGYVAEHRADLLVAALTVLVAHREAGYPAAGCALPSFEGWSRFARDPLTWLGLPDPVATQSETDDETASLGDLLHHLRVKSEAEGKPRFDAKDVAAWCTLTIIGDPERQLVDALLETGCKDPADPRSVSYWLRDHTDGVGSGLKLAAVPFDVNKRRAWTIRKL